MSLMGRRRPAVRAVWAQRRGDAEIRVLAVLARVRLLMLGPLGLPLGELGGFREFAIATYGKHGCERIALEGSWTGRRGRGLRLSCCTGDRRRLRRRLNCRAPRRLEIIYD